MKFIFSSCPLCHSKKTQDFEVVFPASFSEKDLNQRVFSARRLPDKIHYQFVKCKNDGLVRSNPVADPKKLSELYQKSSFTYDSEIPFLVKTYIPVLKKVLLQLPRDAAILEIGCGNGFLLIELMKRGFKNVWGVEPSSDAVKKAPKKLQSKIDAHLFSQKSFPQKKFDFIFFCQTLDHIPDPNAFLKTCYKKLKPGGFILSFHHNANSWSSKMIGERHPIFDIEHTYLFSPETTQKIFEQNDFVVREIFAPQNCISLRHFCQLFPFPKFLKSFLLQQKFSLLNKSLKISLGNTCVIAQKMS